MALCYLLLPTAVSNTVICKLDVNSHLRKRSKGRSGWPNLFWFSRNKFRDVFAALSAWWCAEIFAKRERFRASRSRNGGAPPGAKVRLSEKKIEKLYLSDIAVLYNEFLVYVHQHEKLVKSKVKIRIKLFTNFTHFLKLQFKSTNELKTYISRFIDGTV